MCIKYVCYGDQTIKLYSRTKRNSDMYKVVNVLILENFVPYILYFRITRNNTNNSRTLFTNIMYLCLLNERFEVNMIP